MSFLKQDLNGKFGVRNKLELFRSGWFMSLFRFFCYLSFFVLSSCSIGGGANQSLLSSRVRVYVNPSGEGDRVKFNKPTIFISESREICRSAPLSIRDIRVELEGSGIEEDFLDIFVGELPEQAESREEEKIEPVRKATGRRWLKFGLTIANHNGSDSHPRDNYFLVIENISFTAEAVSTYKKEKLTYNGSIDGDCGSSFPFLYFVPPGKQVNYKPLSLNPLDNLTLFISGFPIIEPSDSQEGKNKGPSRTVIPNYTVRLNFYGYFMTKSGTRIATFEKRGIRFRTQSSIR